MSAQLDPLVSAEWLVSEIAAEDLKVIDATWFLPSEGINSIAEFWREHIPGAVHFDIDAVADRSVPLPHMLADAESFARSASEMGLSNRDRVVVYDRNGMAPSARVWWTFRAFGHSAVALLDGGLAAWIAQGGGTESGALDIPSGAFDAHYNPDTVRDLDQMRALVADPDSAEQIVDARPADRFHCIAPEPREGIRPGRMPGSLNVPSSELVEPGTGALLSPALLRERFEAGGVDLSRPTVTSCGSGVTAALLAFALNQIGAQEAAVYDGSWTEWGGRADTPIET